MEGPTTIWLIRHGAPQGVEGRCYGRHDPPLSSEGVLQANAIAKRLASEPIHHVYSSPLVRALDTARSIAEPHHLTVETLETLCELHYGDLEGLRYEEIRQRYPEIYTSWHERPTETGFPNGEHFSEMRERVMGALALLRERHRQQSIVVVAHSGVTRVVIGHALGVPDIHLFRIAQRYAALNRIDYYRDGTSVELLNASASEYGGQHG